MENKNINLMPEELRSKEFNALNKGKQDFQPDLVVPGAQDEIKLKKDKGESGAKKKNPFWRRWFKSSADTKKIRRPEEPLLVRELKKNGKQVEEQPEKKPAPLLAEEPKDKKDEVKAIEQKSGQDFSMPELVLKKPAKQRVISTEDQSEDASKFHQPTSRVRARFIDEGGGVDLIPVSTKIRSWKQIIHLLVISVLASLGVLVLLYLVLFIQGARVENNQEAKVRTISELEEQILSFEKINQDINQDGQQIELVYNLLNRHIYWTNFFNLLEKYTVEEVYYNGLTAGNNGALTLDAVGSSFDAIARQLKILQQPEAIEFVTLAEITSAEFNDQGVEFSITLILNPDLFYYDNNE